MKLRKWTTVVALFGLCAATAFAAAKVKKPTTSVQVNPAAANALLPNLTIEKIETSSANAKQTTVFVKNTGPSASGPCQLKIDKSRLGTVAAGSPAMFPVGAVGANQTLPVTVTTPFVLGPNCDCYQVYTIDVGNTVKESNENDNGLTRDNVIK
jgi:hypothetical protein